MTSHAVKDFISPEVLIYREQSHSLKAGSSKPNCVKHSGQMEKQSCALSGEIESSHLPVMNFPLVSHETSWMMIWMKVCSYWKRTSITEYFKFDIYPKDIHMHTTVLQEMMTQKQVPCSMLLLTKIIRHKMEITFSWAILHFWHLLAGELLNWGLEEELSIKHINISCTLWRSKQASPN